MAEFKWKKGNKPKESGEYLITFEEDDSSYWTTTDIYDKERNIWGNFRNEEIIAYFPLPSPFRPRRKRK